MLFRSKGYFTYEQANNIALAGSVEGLAVDAAQGIVCAVPGAGITAALTFASALWNGQDIKSAAKLTVRSSIRVLGKSAGIFIATNQLSRAKIINVFAPKLLVGEQGKQIVKGFASVSNPVLTGADKLASNIRVSAVAKSEVGKAVGLDKLEGRQIIGTGVTVAFVYGPDLCRCITGKISFGEFAKRSAENTGGLAGGSFGAAFGSAIAPGIGTVVGGFIGSWIGNSAVRKFTRANEMYDDYEVRDWFTQADATAMFKIFKEEFLDIVMQYNFTKNEFQTIVDDTIGSSGLESVLRLMKMSDNPKEKADDLLNKKVRAVLSNRRLITSDMYQEGMELVRKEVA